MNQVNMTKFVIVDLHNCTIRTVDLINNDDVMGRIFGTKGKGLQKLENYFQVLISIAENRQSIYRKVTIRGESNNVKKAYDYFFFSPSSYIKKN